MRTFGFLGWKVYKEAQDVFFEVRGITKKLPLTDSYIKTQTLRAALSVVLNIAEGSGKSSDKEFIRFLDIALGSLYETRAAIDVLSELGCTKIEETAKIEEKLQSIGRQLGGLRKRAKQKAAA
jgi:four helix bundle protein